MQNYQKYLLLRFELNQICLKYDLDYSEELMIDYVALLLDQNQTPTIKTVLSAKELGSQATIHARLHSLVDRRFLALHQNHDDERVKFVSLGKLGIARAGEIERLFARLEF
jgi:DNA-binding MarR family transcriptional regulator